ncbi:MULTISPECIES: YbgC/FadM family acyl-CoA thioesterase [unclassified Thalassospira]|jgi:acyl-CoA thioester hydrolase|uniref:YbgC/FadM family acyl-CoA thioesterase n=1 Tax=unclassified Thalassospira TaxID=2648997 RepID=UPI001B27E8D5|nr:MULTISPECIES: YbgC/FadM family acyl-CoA thioesterase [unclassified Thalassospira]MBO6807738.1 YbgC/FadM family acyl-CoA thioesterase [Thalassospira sp.]MBO6841052.1 YbgC/FadM family acyl-CoA thioesterase [Thalassospira sp.]|tara:strand:- start:1876 stop:2337 length:462 start_codon:yes stop_codon:yes gene_type:complete
MSQKDHDALLGWLDGNKHIYPLIVYYEDTDAGGIVYHANYLAFAERARSAMLNLLGFTNRNVAERHKVAIAVRHCTLDFRRAAQLEDRLTVESRVIKLGGASLGFEQKIMRDGEELVVIEIYLACMSLEELRAQRLPDELRTVFNRCLDVTKD